MGVLPNHVGIVLDKETYIHSPGKFGAQVRTDKIIEEPIPYQSYYRHLYTTNPIGYKTPTSGLPSLRGSRYYETPLPGTATLRQIYEDEEWLLDWAPSWF